MKNPIVGTAHWGPVYARKIDVFVRNESTKGAWRYQYSSHAYKTCREAVEAGRANFPMSEIKARFAKA